jgi:hypothetical protein
MFKTIMGPRQIFFLWEVHLFFLSANAAQVEGEPSWEREEGLAA